MKTTNDKSDSKFISKISIANTLGYWLATIPPIIIDPKLTHHFRYGARTYAIGWWVLPIGLAVGMVTWLVLKRTQHAKRVFWNSIPLLVASGLTVIALRPEFPHAHVSGMTAMVILLSVATTWIHCWPVETDYARDMKIDRSARLERAKEEILFWRTSVLAMLAVFLAVLISWYGLLLEINERTDSVPSEQFLLNNLAQFFIAFSATWFICGPLVGGVNKCREAQDVLLQIPAQSG